jgi:hypothetical protein
MLGPMKPPSALFSETHRIWLCACATLVYHEGTASHTDLEGHYYPHSLQGLAWGTSRSLTGGLLYRTRHAVDLFLALAWDADNFFSPDDDLIESSAQFLSWSVKAGAIAEIFPDHPTQIFLELMRQDVRLVGDATVLTLGLAMGWQYRPQPKRPQPGTGAER